MNTVMHPSLAISSLDITVEKHWARNLETWTLVLILSQVTYSLEVQCSICNGRREGRVLRWEKHDCSPGSFTKSF